MLTTIVAFQFNTNKTNSVSTPQPDVLVLSKTN